MNEIIKKLMLNEEGLSFDECDLIMNEPQRKRGRPITSKLGGISRNFQNVLWKIHLYNLMRI